MLNYRTAGESHGKGILALVEGFPAGIRVDIEAINRELSRRQGGYGRGGRQRLESDAAEILTGVYRGVTIGSPLAIWIANKDYRLDRLDDLPSPRPGHADLSGAVKFLSGIRPILERASARETVGRVAAGALAKQLLRELEIGVLGYVVGVGPIMTEAVSSSLEELRSRRDASQLYLVDPLREAEIIALIDWCRKEGDTLGGVVEVRVENVPFGLGSHTQWDLRLDGRLAQAVMAIQAIKGVEIGDGFQLAMRRGSAAHDPITYRPEDAAGRSLGFVRPSNRAGGLEGGMTNGQTLVIRAAMKPISTLAQPLPSVNLHTKESQPASYERSDVCAIAACSVIAENVVAFEIARAILEKFGGDTITEIKSNLENFCKLAREHLGIVSKSN